MNDPLCKPARREFIRTLAAGAFLGPAGLVLSPARSAGANETAHASPGIKVRGEVLRTTGQLGERAFQEAAREIPIAGRSQVIVCGGGPAGVGAALAAARAGAEVRLIELAGCLGGVWTAGLLTKILDVGGKGGIMAELLREFAERGGSVARNTQGTVYDPEIAKLVARRVADQCRCQDPAAHARGRRGYKRKEPVGGDRDRVQIGPPDLGGRPLH